VGRRHRVADRTPAIRRPSRRCRHKHAGVASAAESRVGSPRRSSSRSTPRRSGSRWRRGLLTSATKSLISCALLIRRVGLFGCRDRPAGRFDVRSRRRIPSQRLAVDRRRLHRVLESSAKPADHRRWATDHQVAWPAHEHAASSSGAPENRPRTTFSALGGFSFREGSPVASSAAVNG